jgi:ferredoxin
VIALRTTEVRVDPFRCDAHGYCAELLPELIELDEWGYPIVTGEVSAELRVHAERAVAACPKLALRLVERLREPR